MSEVGRFPIIIDSFKASINYWYRMENTSTGLLNDAYSESRSIHEEGGQSWFSAISNVFTILKTPGGNKYKNCSKSLFKHTVKSDLKNIYIETWYNHRNQLVNQNGKLRTYVQIKANFGFENYLDLLTELKLRRCITKFKISCHKLKIESGRYTKPVTPVDDRICDRCNNSEVDDESHFFNNCTKFSETRKTLFDTIKESNVNFHQLSSFHKLLWTFNCENKAILNTLCKFLLESGLT